MYSIIIFSLLFFGIGVPLLDVLPENVAAPLAGLVAASVVGFLASIRGSR